MGWNLRSMIFAPIEKNGNFLFFLQNFEFSYFFQSSYASSKCTWYLLFGSSTLCLIMALGIYTIVSGPIDDNFTFSKVKIFFFSLGIFYTTFNYFKCFALYFIENYIYLSIMVSIKIHITIVLRNTFKLFFTFSMSFSFIYYYSHYNKYQSTHLPDILFF